MGKVHDIFEKELSDVRGRIINSIKGLVIANGLTGQTVAFNDCVSFNGGTINCFNNEHGVSKLVTDEVDSYDLEEVDTDTLLWVLNELEEKNYN